VNDSRKLKHDLSIHFHLILYGLKLSVHLSCFVNEGYSCEMITQHFYVDFSIKALYISDVYIKNKVTLFLQTLFQALVTPSEKHLESHQKVQWRPGSWGPPLNLLLALQMFLRGSYESLKESLQKQSYFVLDIHGCNFILVLI
jgi:hypothetical protein